MTGRRVKAVHGLKQVPPDPPFELEFAVDLRARLSDEQLIEVYERFVGGSSHLDTLMRRTALRALAKRLGSGVNVQPNVRFVHPETLDIGDGVHLGQQTIIQGRFDGRCTIGRGTWIGPQSYFDARDLVIGEYVGWGPGAKVLGSEHAGVPVEQPIIQTDLVIAPVQIEDGADVGVNAIILPGVTVGRGSVVGAGAVVTKDVPAFAKVAGVPARIIGWRNAGDVVTRLPPAPGRFATVQSQEWSPS